jgi:hypothetical protein
MFAAYRCHGDHGFMQLILHLREDAVDGDPATTPDATVTAATPTPKTLAVPWTVPVAASVKGVVHVPAHNTPMKPGGRETLLVAIAKARRWIKEVAQGHSFADIAGREGKAERHVRRLAPLAFVLPRIVTAIIDGTMPAAITATALAAGLPFSWSEQVQGSGRLTPRIASPAYPDDGSRGLGPTRGRPPPAGRKAKVASQVTGSFFVTATLNWPRAALGLFHLGLLKLFLCPFRNGHEFLVIGVCAMERRGSRH